MCAFNFMNILKIIKQRTSIYVFYNIIILISKKLNTKIWITHNLPWMNIIMNTYELHLN